jgi:D-3-phosphoglycerate dehydrogenase / 2-oxoglutarate reductase
MKIVITDHRFLNVEQERRAVEAAGGELVVAQVAEEDKLIHVCREADGLLVARAPITRRVLEAMERCRIIVRYGIGVDCIDVPAATELGILVANVPDYCVDEVSDHALALVLMLSRQMIPAIRLAWEDDWPVSKMPPLRRLRGQICGLFGCGRIGSLVARKVSALGMRVLVHDPHLSEDHAKNLGAELVPFEELLEGSDYVSLHAPLNAGTRHRFGEAAFARMKTTAYLINTSRGGLLDEAALLNALDAGNIAGAGLDVLESENSVTAIRKVLVNHPRIIVSAHTAWFSQDALATLKARAIEQVLACFKGETPYSLVNPEAKRRHVSQGRSGGGSRGSYPS